jgi:hypothetical protein
MTQRFLDTNILLSAIRPRQRRVIAMLAITTLAFDIAALEIYAADPRGVRRHRRW